MTWQMNRVVELFHSTVQVKYLMMLILEIIRRIVFSTRRGCEGGAYAKSCRTEGLRSKWIELSCLCRHEHITHEFLLKDKKEKLRLRDVLF